MLILESDVATDDCARSHVLPSVHLSHQIRSSHEEVEHVSPTEALKFCGTVRGRKRTWTTQRKGFFFSRRDVPFQIWHTLLCKRFQGSWHSIWPKGKMYIFIHRDRKWLMCSWLKEDSGRLWPNYTPGFKDKFSGWIKRMKVILIHCFAIRYDLKTRGCVCMCACICVCMCRRWGRKY